MDTYLITGASSDLGIEFLRRLERNRMPALVLCQYYRTVNQLEELQSSFKHLSLRLYQCDLSSAAATSKWIEQLASEDIQPTHILHLAAVAFEYTKLSKFDWEKTVKELTVQVNALAQIFKVFLPKMAKLRRGKVVAMLSAYTLGIPPKFMSDYVIAKYALWGLLKTAASEYSGKGISINGISPNMIETRFLKNIDSRIVEMTANQCTMQRNITKQEVVDSIMFLLSEASNYITGINLNLSGGDR